METFCHLSGNAMDLVASRFRALGEPYRLRILQALKRRSMRVGELVDELDGNQSNVSKHLQILLQADIVSRRREGKHVIYSLTNPETFTLCELAHQSQKRGSFDLKARQNFIQSGQLL